MGWRIAVTSADGVLINQHFGHAKWFFILDVETDGSYVVAEKRSVEPWCQGGENDASAEKTPAENLRDCTAVVTARIGTPAMKKLELAGITVFEHTAPIDEAVKKLAAYYAKTKA
jgi:predicted Fe-Mo cluster-binding NifX family protein